MSKYQGARPAARDLRAWLTAGVPRAQETRALAGAHDVAPTQLVLSRTWQPSAITASAPPPAVRPARRRPVAVLAAAAALAAVAGGGTAYALDAAGPSGAPSPAALPTVTFGRYAGREPAAIVLNGSDGGGTIDGIHWTSWTAKAAVGDGILGPVLTQVRLSSPVGGRFTRIGETSNGQLIVQAYPDNHW